MFILAISFCSLSKALGCSRSAGFFTCLSAVLLRKSFCIVGWFCFSPEPLPTSPAPRPSLIFLEYSREVSVPSSLRDIPVVNGSSDGEGTFRRVRTKCSSSTHSGCKSGSSISLQGTRDEEQGKAVEKLSHGFQESRKYVETKMARLIVSGLIFEVSNKPLTRNPFRRDSMCEFQLRRSRGPPEMKARSERSAPPPGVPLGGLSADR